MFKKIVFFLVLLSFLVSCNHNDDDIATNSSVNNFVWKGLNSWYYWQEDVPNLADEVALQENYLSLLNEYQNPEDFYYSMLNDYPNTDRFSWIVSDYNTLLNTFQGTSFSTGFDFGLVPVSQGSNELFGYVRYVLPNSIAQTNGIERGDIFTQVNGITLTRNNYTDLLYGNSSYTIGLADYLGGNLVNNNIQKQVQGEVINENPVFYKNVYTQGTHKIGYLVYNAFTFTYNKELNDAFAYFNSENINGLVLDLRYNGGGSVETATYLASMINGNQNGNIFARLQFNAKHPSSNRNYNFSNTLIQYNTAGASLGNLSVNSVNVNKVVVLTTFSTASASELIINGLRPYVEVVTVGETTRGKDVGSITVFDSPNSDYTNPNTATSAHTYAMQPIVFKSFNANNQGDYSNGFAADYPVNELDYLADLKPLGDETEALLATALNQWTGGNAPPQTQSNFNQTNLKVFKTNKDNTLLGDAMYIVNP